MAWHTCLSCKHSIGEEYPGPSHDQDWLNYYRALYYRTPDGAKLSDVLYADDLWRQTKDKGWHHLESSERKALLEGLGPWFEEICSRHARVHMFHENCWIFLNLQLPKEEDLDLNRLFEICQQIPNPVDRIIGMYMGAKRTYPFGRPRAPNIILSRKRLKPREAGYRLSETDCFRMLPLELRSLIAINLSTSDFLRLRQASLSMAEVFEDRLFWRSRFLPRGERGYFNHLLKNREGLSRTLQGDWRLIYKSSLKLDSDSHFFDHRRRWHTNRWLGERYTMTKTSYEEIGSYTASASTSTSTTDSNELLSQISWKSSQKCVSLEVKCDRIRRRDLEVRKRGWTRRKCYNYDCMMEFKHVPSIQTVLLKSSVLYLAIYFLRESYHTHITGLGLLESDCRPGKPSLVLGYCIPDQYGLINVREGQLTGFNLITGAHAIHAMQAVFEEGFSNWVGEGDGFEACRSRFTRWDGHVDEPSFVQLATENGVQVLSVKFDYCKLVGLSIV